MEKEIEQKLIEDEEWIKRLIDYRTKIEEGVFTKEDVPQMMEDLLRTGHISNGIANLNKMKLKAVLEKVKLQIAEYYGCKEEEICTNSISYREMRDNYKPYKIVLGDVDFNHFVGQGKSVENLEIILGNADFSESWIENLNNLTIIGGNVKFHQSQNNLGNLQYIGGNVDFGRSNVTSLGNLQAIGGNVDFGYSKVTNLGNLQSIGGNVNFERSKITSLGNLSNAQVNREKDTK